MVLKTSDELFPQGGKNSRGPNFIRDLELEFFSWSGWKNFLKVGDFYFSLWLLFYRDLTMGIFFPPRGNTISPKALSLFDLFLPLTL